MKAILNLFTCETWIYIIAISLQVSGAICLIINYWGNVKKKVILSYYEGSGLPKAQEDNTVKLEAELTELINHSKEKKGFGYSIEYTTVKTKLHGVQDLPSSIVFQSENDYLKFIGKFDIPMPEPTPEELAAEEKARKKRAAERAKYERRKERKRQQKLEAERQAQAAENADAPEEETA